MNREEIKEIIKRKVTSKKFHWFSYHFNLENHILAESIVECCTRIESRIEGFAENFSNKIASLSDKNEHMPHYEQLIQLLSEILVINYLCEIFSAKAKFTFEPTIRKNGKNPEVGIKEGDKEFYIEVKCREFFKHSIERGEAKLELPSRINGFKELGESIIEKGDSIVYPRDNAVKDFLISSNEKFKEFKLLNKNSITVLVIVWDDFIYEAISSLMNDFTGLLTENSFYKKDGSPVKFENIDSIILIRHSHQIVASTRDEPLFDNLLDPLAWESGLPKVYIPVNSCQENKKILCELFQANHIDDLVHFAEYRPLDMVFRIPSRHRR